MKKFLAVAALLALAGCGEKKASSPAAADTAAAHAAPDSTMPRDSAHQ
jgi:predicted small lipoprotein YifL